MNNSPLEFETWLRQSLRENVPTPSPSRTDEVVRTVLSVPKAQPWKVRARWLASAVAVAGTAAVLLHPSPSAAALTLEQVDAAAQLKDHYTLRYSITDGKTAVFTTTELRDGAKWKFTYWNSARVLEEIAMDGTKTVTLLPRRSGQPQLAYIDGPAASPKKSASIPTATNFATTPSELFRSKAGPITSTLGVEWHGRQVDKFESVSPVTIAKNQREVLYLRHVLYVDPQTHLPIHMESGWVGPSQVGESFDYDFNALPASSFEATIPKNTQVYDLRRERLAVRASLSDKGMLLIDLEGRVGVFPPSSLSQVLTDSKQPLRVQFGGQKAVYGSWHAVQTNAEGDADVGTTWPQPVIIAVAGKAALGSHQEMTVTVQGHRLHLPVRHVASLVREFEYAGRFL